MNVYLKLCFKSFLFVVFSSIATAAELEHDDFDHKIETRICHGLEPFNAAMRYEIVVRNEEGDRKLALAKRAHTLNKFADGTNVSKSELDKDSFYSIIAENLPAGTLFRVAQAYDNQDDDVTVINETKGVLPSMKPD